MIVNSIKKNT